MESKLKEVLDIYFIVEQVIPLWLLVWLFIKLQVKPGPAAAYKFYFTFVAVHITWEGSTKQVVSKGERNPIMVVSHQATKSTQVSMPWITWTSTMMGLIRGSCFSEVVCGPALSQEAKRGPTQIYLVGA